MIEQPNYEEMPESNLIAMTPQQLVSVKAKTVDYMARTGDVKIS